MVSVPSAVVSRVTLCDYFTRLKRASDADLVGGVAGRPASPPPVVKREPREPRYVTLFQAALAGDVPGKHERDWLTPADVDKAVREVPFPPALATREAKIRAVKWADSSSGRSIVWARALRMAGAGAAAKPSQDQTQEARKAVIAECTVAMKRDLKEGTSIFAELFWKFVGDCRSRGGGGSETFEQWLASTHEDWKSKQDALKHWLADKDRDAFRLHGELSQVAVVSKLMHVVEQMVNSLAGSAQHLEITGAMSKLRRLAVRATTDPEGAALSVMSRDSFFASLKDVLKRLAVLPQTAGTASELLDARGAARRQCAAVVRTPGGRQRLEDVAAALGVDVEDPKAAQGLEEELYQSIVSKVFVSSGSKAVEVAEQESAAARERVDRTFQEWVTRKDAAARAVREAAAAAALATANAEKERRKRSRSAVRQWSRAMQSNCYVSHRSRTPTRVPRPADAQVVGRPLWVDPKPDTPSPQAGGGASGPGSGGGAHGTPPAKTSGGREVPLGVAPAAAVGHGGGRSHGVTPVSGRGTPTR